MVIVCIYKYACIPNYSLPASIVSGCIYSMHVIYCLLLACMVMLCIPNYLPASMVIVCIYSVHIYQTTCCLPLWFWGVSIVCMYTILLAASLYGYGVHTKLLAACLYGYSVHISGSCIPYYLMSASMVRVCIYSVHAYQTTCCLPLWLQCASTGRMYTLLLAACLYGYIVDL